MSYKALEVLTVAFAIRALDIFTVGVSLEVLLKFAILSSVAWAAFMVWK